MNGIGWTWPGWVPDVFGFEKEQAFARVFDIQIKARNAVRKGFEELEGAKARLGGFYAQFTGLDASRERSQFRRLYQDIKGELDESERRLTNLSTDLAVVQDAASKAYAGTTPYELVNGEVAVAGIQTRGIEPADIEAAKRQFAGVGAVLTTTLLIFLWAILAGATATAAVFIDKNRRVAAANIEVANIQRSMGKIPGYIDADGAPLVQIGPAAGISIATIAVVGLVGWWLAKGKKA